MGAPATLELDRLEAILDGDLRVFHRRGPDHVEPGEIEALIQVADATSSAAGQRARIREALNGAIDDYTDDEATRHTIKLWYGLVPESRELGPTQRHELAWEASGSKKSYHSYRTRDLPSFHGFLARRLFLRYASAIAEPLTINGELRDSTAPAIEVPSIPARAGLRGRIGDVCQSPMAYAAVGLALIVGVVVANPGDLPTTVKPPQSTALKDPTVATWRSTFADRDAPDVPGAVIAARLNAQRAAHRIPRVSHDPAETAGCRRLARRRARQYMGVERQAPPPTETGILDVSRYAIIDYYVQWGRGSNPAEDAPLHLLMMLAPRLNSIGAYEAHGVSCVTAASLNREPPLGPKVYTYPSDGSGDWRTEERPIYLNRAQYRKLGIEAGDILGPTVFAMFDSPNLTPFAKARVIGSAIARDTSTNRQVDVVSFDYRDLSEYEFAPPAVLVTFTKPLRPFTEYEVTLHADVTDPYSRRVLRFDKVWSFRTGPTIHYPPRRKP